MRILKLIIVVTAFHGINAFSAPLAVGEAPSVIKLEGDQGGKVSGEPWSSEEIAKTGKVMSLFYVDPEEKKLNEIVEEAYDKEKFPLEKHGNIAVINMAAAWYPNSVIASMLKKKQEQFPMATYVKDMKKTIVKEWALQDDSVNVVVFARDGKVIFMRKGKMSPEEVPGLMKIIRENL